MCFYFIIIMMCITLQKYSIHIIESLKEILD